jgi:hypothetical protein
MMTSVTAEISERHGTGRPPGCSPAGFKAVLKGLRARDETPDSFTMADSSSDGLVRGMPCGAGQKAFDFTQQMEGVKVQGGAKASHAARVEDLAWCVHGRRAAVGCAMDIGGATVNVVVAAMNGALSVTLVSDGRIPNASLQAAAVAVRRMYPGARVSCNNGGRR